MDFATFQEIPKAELHVHLEGAILPERLLSWVANDSHHPWHGQTLQSLATQFKMATFPEFIQAFMTGYSLLNSEKRFQQITEDLCASLETQGVVYAEILYSPGVLIQQQGVFLDHIHQGIRAGLRQFPNLQTRFILDTVLNLGPKFMSRTLKQVLARRPDFLGGFSIGGGLPDIRLDPFLPLFEEALEAGLFCVAHVGEVDSANNIHYLLTHTDLQRIAHGCAAVEDAVVLDLMKKRGITVDICLTSNQFTGASQRFKKLPAATFLEEGIPITINTDDPLYFGCTLYDEYQFASRELKLGDDQLRAIMAKGLTFAEINRP